MKDIKNIIPFGEGIIAAQMFPIDATHKETGKIRTFMALRLIETEKIGDSGRRVSKEEWDVLRDKQEICNLVFTNVQGVNVVRRWLDKVEEGLNAIAAEVPHDTKI